MTTATRLTYEDALAYLGGSLFDAIKAEGHPVSTRGTSLLINYLNTTAILMELRVVEGAHNQYVIRAESSVLARKRPGVYDFNDEGRINLPGLLSVIKREREAMRLELEAEKQRHVAAEAARLVAEANEPLAAELRAIYTMPPLLAAGDPQLPIGMRAVYASDEAEGQVALVLRDSVLQAPRHLARALLDALRDIHEYHYPASKTADTATNPAA